MTTFKFLFSACLCCLLLVFTSCSKDDLKSDLEQQSIQLTEILKPITAENNQMEPAEMRRGKCYEVKRAKANGNISTEIGIVRFNINGNRAPSGVKGSFLIRLDGIYGRGQVVEMYPGYGENSAYVQIKLTATNSSEFSVGDYYGVELYDGGNGGTNDYISGEEITTGNVAVTTQYVECEYESDAS